MTNLSDAIIFFVVLAVVAMLFFVFGVETGKHNLLREAYERGHAVQCLGKTGYFWECEP